MVKKKGFFSAKAKAKPAAGRAGEGEAEADFDDGAPIVPLDGRRVRRGLANLGNTCFMNSVVQCLNASLPFSDTLLGIARDHGLDGLAGHVCAVFRGIRGAGPAVAAGGSDANTFSPKAMHADLVERFPWYGGRQQQDAHEFLRMLLGCVSDEATAVERCEDRGRDAPPGLCGQCVSESFRGHTCAMTLCWGCGRVSSRLDAFLDLQLPLPPLPAVAAAAAAEGAPLGVMPPAAALSLADAAAERAAAAEIAAESGKKLPSKKVEPQKLRGAWGVASDKAAVAELRAPARILVERIECRILLRQGAERITEAPIAEIDVELSRPAGKKSSGSCQWGFRWSKPLLDDDLLVVSSIVEDSLLDRWNLKRMAAGEEDRVVRAGDRLDLASGRSGRRAIQAALPQEDSLELRFARLETLVARAQAGDLLPEESEGEAEREAARLAAEEADRRAFAEYRRRAVSCHRSLAPSLQSTFGSPEPAAPGADPLHRKVEDCFREFVAVEALEDKYQPTYRCARCCPTGDKSSRTFASRRAWLWPTDLPPLLTLSIQRFRCYSGKYEKSKLSVAVPACLDLGEFVLSHEKLKSMAPACVRVDEETADGLGIGSLMERLQREGPASARYELYALCEHRGDEMQKGHYVAYVNNGPSLAKEQWFGLSDGKVWKCDRAEALRAEAYIVFYRRQGVLERDGAAGIEDFEAGGDVGGAVAVESAET